MSETIANNSAASVVACSSNDRGPCIFAAVAAVRDSAGEGAAPAAAVRLIRAELASGYARYRAIAAKRLRDCNAADEVVQAFALKALERAGQLRDPQAVHGWLRRLFDTTLIDFCRRRTTRGQREVAFDLDHHDRADETIADLAPDPAKTVIATLARLKPEYAETIYRLDLLDQPKQAVADQLGITVNNLAVRAHRARRALRDALEAMPISGIATGRTPAFARVYA